MSFINRVILFIIIFKIKIILVIEIIINFILFINIINIGLIISNIYIRLFEIKIKIIRLIENSMIFGLLMKGVFGISLL